MKRMSSLTSINYVSLLKMNECSMEVLQYLVQYIDSSWGPSTFSLAVKGGNLSILKWLKEEGCTWDTTVFITAIQTGDREIIRWLYEENCPMNKTAMDELMVKFVYNRYESDKDEEEDYGEYGEEEEEEDYDEEEEDSGDEDEEDDGDNDETGNY